MASLREALEGAIDEGSSGGTDSNTIDVPSREVSDAPSLPAPVTPDETQSTEAAQTPAKETRSTVRDALGRFVPKTPDAAKPDAVVPQGTAAPQPQATQQPTVPDAGAAPGADKPPASWGVGPRQHWAAIPPEARAEILRRDTEVAQVLTQTAQVRQFASRLMQTIQPYQQAIQAETGGDVIKAVHGLMDTANRLRYGTPQEKATTIASLFKAYAVDLDLLDQALAGVAPQPGTQQPADINAAVQQALQPLFQRAQQRMQETQAQATERINNELSIFANEVDPATKKPKHEFFQDVRDLMADVFDMYEKRGVQIDLTKAYNDACLLHPEVSKVLETRRAATSVTTLSAAAQRAKAAAVSVSGNAPMGNPNGPEPTSIRSAIESAIETHTRA